MVPTTECPISEVEFDTLKSNGNPMEEQDDYGVGLYAATQAFVMLCNRIYDFVHF